MEETARQRFIRNSQENNRAIRARQRHCEKIGDVESADSIRKIADTWDEITAEAVRQENESAGSESGV